MMLQSGAGTVSKCAPSMARRCACPARCDCHVRPDVPRPQRSRDPGADLAGLRPAQQAHPGRPHRPYHRDERDLLVEHLAALEAGCLLLLDMGYPAFWVFAALQTRKIAWCARVALDTWSVVREFLAAGQADAWSRWNPTQALADCRAHGLPTTPIRVRLIRVLLPTGNIEVLMTSLLDPDTYPADAFAELYHLRWAQEECYKCFKSRVEVENWSGKSALTICQDFHAKVLALNLTAVLASTAQEIVDDRLRRRSSQAGQHDLRAAAMKNALVRLLTRANPVELLRRLIDIVARTVEPVRPGRSYPRRKGPRLHGYYGLQAMHVETLNTRARKF